MARHFEAALHVAERIRVGEITSAEITNEMLQRIAGLDSYFKSYVTVMAEEAMQAANQADEEISQGKIRSALHGVPIAIKDLLDVKGVQTTYGMKIYEGHLPDRDATVVAKLKSAGCILLGKLKLTEGALAYHHPSVDLPVNPWNEDCWTGVSSSGSGVATAAGLCFASIGSDTGGSIRSPSASNGLVGLKPTWGRVSRHGAFPLAYTLDHLGPMTRSVKDAAAMLEIIAGRDVNDATTSNLPVENYVAAITGDIRGLKVGIDWRYCQEDVDAEVSAAIDDAMALLTKLGVETNEVKLPVDAVITGWAITCSVECAHAHKETYPSRKAEYGPISSLIDLGLATSASTYMEQEIVRRSFKASINGVFENVDILLCPSLPFAAANRERSSETDAITLNILKFTAPFNFSGNPTLSIPWNIGSKGIPLSIQLIGRDFAEASLLNVGYALEQAGGHFDNHPATD